MTFNEVINAVDGLFNTCGIVSVKCTVKHGNGKIYNSDIIVANCDEDDFEDYYGDVANPAKHTYICCGIEELKDFYEFGIGCEILSLDGVEKFVNDF